MINKTNQFNLALERPTPAEIDTRVDSGNELYCVRLEDRFGEYGIIAVLELRPRKDHIALKTFVISCRALGRRVEDALLSYAAERAQHYELTSIEAEFVQGPRNQQVINTLGRMGFSEVSRTENAIRFVHNRLDELNWPEVIERGEELEVMDFGT